MTTEPIIGTAVPRKEGVDKVTGRARYIDDITLPGMIFGATVRSSIPRGKIKKIRFGPEVNWDEFVIVSARDIPGTNCVALISEDQPCLADGAVNHPEEPILLLAHENRYLLPQAVRAVSIEYEPLPAIFTIEESEQQKEVIWGADNVFKRYVIEKGSVDSVWEKAAYVVEGEYTTGAQEQLYIENNGVGDTVMLHASVRAVGEIAGGPDQLDDRKISRHPSALRRFGTPPNCPATP